MLPTTQGRSPTVQDIISLHKDRAMRLGELALTTHFPRPQDIFRPLNNGDATGITSTGEDPADDEHAIAAAMQATHEDIVRLDSQERFMKKPANEGLMQRTEAEINQRLLAKGKSKRYVGGQGLHQKVISLIEMSTPEERPNFVTVKVNVGQFKAFRDMRWINLPLNASIAEVYQLLYHVTLDEGSCSSAKERLELKRAVWKYQLLLPNPFRTMSKASIPLETGSDYRRMLQQITKDGKKSPTAVLSRAENSSEESQKAEKEDLEVNIERDSTLPEVLDDDGTPFFGALDLEAIQNRYLDSTAAKAYITANPQRLNGKEQTPTTHSHYTRASAKD